MAQTIDEVATRGSRMHVEPSKQSFVLSSPHTTHLEFSMEYETAPDRI